jgi:bacillithiol biosynthesis cysteine-adding enzyme BshC
MNCTAKYIPYQETGAFSAIANDYLSNDPALQPFYTYHPDEDGFKKALEARKGFATDRALLVNQFTSQYAEMNTSKAVRDNIASLLDENTFTICTAHQPNIFTGHLYFIYKILHAIRMADDMNNSIPGHHFVPVYYMGSEDADLDELGEVHINGKHYRWNTNQQGAVGRMKVDKGMIAMMDEMQGQLSVEPFGADIVALMRNCYVPGRTIEAATFELADKLFSTFGLLVFLPDHAAVKRPFNTIVHKELVEQFSQKAVAETIAAFPEKYKVQAAGREINLFYLEGDSRERIEKNGDHYVIANSTKTFSLDELLNELDHYPERFSPNVILRPLFQELLLPNVSFIGGGGELAYWLELKNVFGIAGIPFPQLILRNSFMLVPAKTANTIKKLGLSITDFFKPELQLVNELVHRDSRLRLTLAAEKTSIENLYSAIGSVATAVDTTLQQHTEALKKQALHKITRLETKMLRAEKKKMEASLRQLSKARQVLYPGAVLQERVDNLMSFYPRWGQSFIESIYQYSTSFTQQFCILEES